MGLRRGPLFQIFPSVLNLMSELIPVQCIWQQELCMRENIDSLGWAGPRCLSGLDLCFLFHSWCIGGYLPGPELAFVINRTDGGRPFTFVAFWGPKEKRGCSRNPFWLNFCEADKLDNSYCVSSGVMGLCGFPTRVSPPSTSILPLCSRIIKVWGNTNLYLPLIKQGPTSYP